MVARVERLVKQVVGAPGIESVAVFARGCPRFVHGSVPRLNWSGGQRVVNPA